MATMYREHTVLFVLQAAPASPAVREGPVTPVDPVALVHPATLEAPASQDRRVREVSTDLQEIQVPLAAQVLPEVPVFKVGRAHKDLQDSVSVNAARAWIIK